eukprot:10730396-Alexandrium_andersonii.AAC.1
MAGAFAVLHACVVLSWLPAPIGVAMYNPSRSQLLYRRRSVYRGESAAVALAVLNGCCSRAPG